MKQFIRDYLTFNKRERNGVFVLLIIVFLLIVYLTVSSHLYASEKVDFSSFAKTIAQFELQDSMSEHIDVKTVVAFKKEERFEFNPNHLPDKTWERLGLSEKQIRIIKNYESKGGKFKTKKDLAKIYGLPKQLFLSLEPFIQFQDVFKKKEPTVKKIPIVLIELNSTDSAQLTTVKGIGPFYAKTIIKYRNQLGGYVKKEQLMEIWKFDQEKFNAIEKFIEVDTGKIKKININLCKAEELKHPYLTWNMVNAIVNYRNAHGKFKTIDDIQKTDLVDEETLRKIAAYLTLE